MPGASSVEFDQLYFFLTGVTAFFVVVLGVLVVYFTIRYRRDSDEVGADTHGALILELTWTIIPLVLSTVMFLWGASQVVTIWCIF